VIIQVTTRLFFRLAYNVWQINFLVSSRKQMELQMTFSKCW